MANIMATQQVERQSKFIVSYPSPPLYLTSIIAPPSSVPSSCYATLSDQYNGSVSIHLEGRKIYCDSKDYKKELRR